MNRNKWDHVLKEILSGRMPLKERLHWIFRISLAMCFIGHGAFGIITKAEWLPYFAIASIDPEWCRLWV